MGAKPRVLTITSRAATVVVAGAVAVVGVGATSLLQLDSPELGAKSFVVQPLETVTSEACSGWIFELGADASQAQSSVPVGVPLLAFDEGWASSRYLAQYGYEDSDVAVGPLVLSAPKNAAPALATSAQAVSAQGETVAGFTATACQVPTRESWLVAGSTLSGQTSLVMLANPSDAASDVTLDVYGTAGFVGSEAVRVAPGQSRAIPLAGIAPDNEAPVVHVSAVGGRVSAFMQHSRVSGIVAAGLDVSGAVSSLETALVVPGVKIGPFPEGEEVKSSPIVRLFAPGNGEGHFSVSVLDAASGTEVSHWEDHFVASQVAELTLDALPAGQYAIKLETDLPTVASAFVENVGAPTPDFTRYEAASVLRSGVVLPVVDVHGAANLTVMNPGVGELHGTVTVGGAARQVDLAGGGQLVIATQPGDRVVLDVPGAVASLLYEVDGARSAYPVPNDTVAADSVNVRILY